MHTTTTITLGSCFKQLTTQLLGLHSPTPTILAGWSYTQDHPAAQLKWLFAGQSWEPAQG